MEFLGFDHIDCRVRSLAAVEAFYDRLLPELGFPERRTMHVDDAGEWFDASAELPYNTVEYYEAPRTDRARFFIGIIERPDHLPSQTRIAFRVASERLLELESKLAEFGARNIERNDDMESYPAIFFEDPSGTRLEIVARHPS